MAIAWSIHSGSEDQDYLPHCHLPRDSTRRQGWLPHRDEVKDRDAANASSSASRAATATSSKISTAAWWILQLGPSMSPGFHYALHYNDGHGSGSATFSDGHTKHQTWTNEFHAAHLFAPRGEHSGGLGCAQLRSRCGIPDHMEARGNSRAWRPHVAPQREQAFRDKNTRPNDTAGDAFGLFLDPHLQ